MQIKYNFSALLFFCFLQTTSIGQSTWLLPLSTDYVAGGKMESLYFTTSKHEHIYFDKDGKRNTLNVNVKKALGGGLFLFEKDTFLGITEGGGKIIIPAAYEKIEYISPDFFEVANYGAWGIVNNKNQMILSYHFRPQMPFLKSADTLLVKFSLHPDAKAQGFLRNGTKLEESLATKLYPTKDKRIAPYTPPLPPTTHATFVENRKQGIKTKDGQVVVAAEYDEIKEGFPGYFAVRKGKEWGLFSLN